MEVSPAPAAPELSWRAAAAWLALPLVGLLALIAIHLTIDNGHRRELERAVEVTAVGDGVWYLVPKPEPVPPAAVTSYQGQPLLPVSYRIIEMRDSRLNLLGYDDAGKLRVYTTRDPAPARNGESERRNEPVYLIKTGPEQYLKVQPSGKGK